MEDKELEQKQEEGTLNQQEEENQEEETQEDTPKTYTEEEVEEMRKKLQSDSEKWVQKVINERKLYEKAFEEVGNIAEDDKRLVDIYEENPELWKLILTKYFNGQTIDEYKDSISFTEDYSDPKRMEAKIKREAEKLAAQKELEKAKESIDKSKTAFIDKLKMSDEEREAFEETFEELSSLKSFKIDNIQKVMEKAYRISNDNEESINKLKAQEVIARATASTKGGGTSQESKDPKAKIKKDIEAFKKKFNL